MRDYIKKQLENCAFADISNISANTKTVIIPRYSKPKYDVGRCYLIKISPFILNNPDSVLASNWNKGTFPISEYMKVYVTEMKGKMIFIEGVDYNFNDNVVLDHRWSGWLSSDDIKQIAIL